MTMVQVLRRIAIQNADLRNEHTESLVLTLCQEAYRAGVIEMQEPVVLWKEVSPPEDPKS